MEIVLNGIKKSFNRPVLNGINLVINNDSYIAIEGKSGSGKSTLMNIIGLIEEFDEGMYDFNGTIIKKGRDYSNIRLSNIGFIFQSYNLITSMNALENVALPLVFKEEKVKVRNQKAKDMLVQVGLAERLKHRPNQMSGGQQQRVGIARAFVSNPEIVFADEPTGNLDSKTSKEIMEIIQKIAKEHNQTIVMVTHDESIAAYANKIVHIHDGQIEKIVEVVKDEEIN